METTAPDDEDLPVSRPRVLREVAIGGSTLLVGFVVIPLLIYMMGRSTLGPYAHGGAAKLLADFYTGLGHGAPAFWAVGLGPYVMTLFVRFVYFLVRRKT